jgi:X-X-X-Leu-X-X-Gly heptad repeat protein
MTDAVESRASIINDYVSSAEEYMTAFASVKGIFEGLYVGKELMRVESAIRHLGNLDLSAGQELDTFHGRKDEIGMIAQTTRSLCGRLQKTIDDIVRILGEMAEGNIAVDVSMNESYYIGDFRILSDSLKTIRYKLTNLMRDISRVANQVDTGAYQLSSGVQTLSQGTMEQSVSVTGLVTHVTDLTSQINDSAVRCSNASELVDKANGYADEADEKNGTVDCSHKECRSIFRPDWQYYKDNRRHRFPDKHPGPQCLRGSRPCRFCRKRILCGGR